MALKHNSLFKSAFLMWCLSQMFIHVDADESVFTITSECASPKNVLTFECSVIIIANATGISGRSLVWQGTAFDCPSAKNRLILLTSRVDAHSCNSGTIVGWNINTYTSRLNVTISSDNNIIGKTITCDYDNGTMLNPGSIKLIKTGIPLNIRYKVDNSKKRIVFTWSQPCATAILDHYNIRSNCGRCPTTTNHTNVTCIDVPTEVDYCLFVISGRSLPATSVDVDLRGYRKHMYSGLIAAYILLPITIIIIVMLISIAIIFRFKGYMKRSITNANNQVIEVQRGTATQYEEIDVYSHQHKNLEISDGVMKIFENDVNGIYGIPNESDDGGCQDGNKSGICNFGVHSHQSLKGEVDIDSSIYSQIGGSDSIKFNVDNLLMIFGGKIQSQWWKLGLALGVPRSILNKLSGEDIQCLKIVFDHWLKHHPSEPTWAEITEAQKKIHFQSS